MRLSSQSRKYPNILAARTTHPRAGDLSGSPCARHTAKGRIHTRYHGCITGLSKQHCSQHPEQSAPPIVPEIHRQPTAHQKRRLLIHPILLLGIRPHGELDQPPERIVKPRDIREILERLENRRIRKTVDARCRRQQHNREREHRQRPSPAQRENPRRQEDGRHQFQGDREPQPQRADPGEGQRRQPGQRQSCRPSKACASAASRADPAAHARSSVHTAATSARSIRLS